MFVRLEKKTATTPKTMFNTQTKNELFTKTTNGLSCNNMFRCNLVPDKGAHRKWHFGASVLFRRDVLTKCLRCQNIYLFVFKLNDKTTQGCEGGKNERTKWDICNVCRVVFVLRLFVWHRIPIRSFFFFLSLSFSPSIDICFTFHSLYLPMFLFILFSVHSLVHQVSVLHCA